MKHRTVKDKYAEWSAGRLDAEERREIREHLDGCDECRVYYEKMSLIMERTDPALLPRLAPDPLLPARVRALARTRGAEPVRPPALGWFRASLAGVVLMAAVSAGVLLGISLSDGSITGEGIDIAQEYYEAFSPSDFSGTWEDVLTETNGAGSANGGKVNGSGSENGEKP